MSHYAKVVDGIVVNTIVAEPEFFNTFIDSSPGEWIKTSYNIRGGIYYDPSTGEPHENQEEMIAEDEGRQRKNCAGIGQTYDRVRNAFISLKPEDSWILNEDSCEWETPTEGETRSYIWDKSNQTWIINE